MQLSIIKDGQKYPYSRARLKKDNPNVSFPKDLSQIDLSQFNVVLDTEEKEIPAQVEEKPTATKVPMHCFLWGLREFGIRVQFEHYYLSQEGFARDYWFTAPMVSRKHVCVQHFKDTFKLSESDLDDIFTSAFGIEE